MTLRILLVALTLLAGLQLTQTAAAFDAGRGILDCFPLDTTPRDPLGQDIECVERCLTSDCSPCVASPCDDRR